MNIAILDLDDIQNPLLGAGQATATYEVGKRLAKRGHTITVYCSKFPGYTDRVQEGIRYVHIGVNTSNIKLNNFLFILLAPFAVMRLRDADILIESFVAPISTLFSPLFTRIPVIALPSMFNAAEFSRKYHLPFTWIERFGMRFYRYMLPYSETDKNKALSMNKVITYSIVPQGVSGEYFAIRQKTPKHILFLSRFDIAQKGIDLLLHAYKKIADNIEYPLVLAGHGPDEKEIRKLIHTLGLEKKVTIVGSAYGDMKKKLMSEALYTVFPSRHDEMCLWALESLAGGLPLIGFDIPESKWMTKKITMKAKAFNIDQYADILVSAAKKNVIQPLRINSRIFAKQYSWETVVDKFEQFFTLVLSKERAVYERN